MDPTTSCNLICPKGQPPSSVLVPGRDRRDGSMEGRPGSKGSTERGHFASKGDPFGWGVGWVTGWKPSEGIGWLNGGFEVCFCFFLCVGDAQLTRILQILHGIFVDEHISLRTPRYGYLMIFVCGYTYALAIPVKHWCLSTRSGNAGLELWRGFTKATGSSEVWIATGQGEIYI